MAIGGAILQQEPFTAMMWPLTHGQSVISEVPTPRYNVLTAVLPWEDW
jgi:hypothetical protein